MMNKKLLGTALVGLMVVGASGQVLAATVVNNPDGTQTVNGKGTPEGEDVTGVMPVRGNLGEADNTDPEAPIDENSNDWINVTFPTAAIFAADKDGNIESGTYKMKNNSGRGVDISVLGYEIDEEKSAPEALAALTELKLVASDDRGDIILAQNGASVITGPDKKIGRLQAVNGFVNFEFGGEAAKIVDPKDDTAYNIQSAITFKFTPLADDRAN